MSREIKYIGMDVHKEAIVTAVLSDSGKQVMQSIVETKASGNRTGRDNDERDGYARCEVNRVDLGQGLLELQSPASVTRSSTATMMGDRAAPQLKP